MKSNSLILVFAIVLVVRGQFLTASVSSTSCCNGNQIEVSGQGKSSALPDVAIVNIRFDQKGQTSLAAVRALSAKVNQAINVLKANGYSADSYQTSSVNVFPEYNFLNGRSQIIGQRATQSLTIRANNIDSKGQKIGILVDSLANINGVNIDSVTFDIADKTKLQTEARAAAFRDARAKAQDYASFAGVSLGRVVTIDDIETVSARPIALGLQTAKLASFDGGAATTSVPVGELDVNYRTTVTFAIQ